jgi:hypothetical protein
MSFTVRHEPKSEEDRVAIEKLAAEYLSHGASPVVPLCAGAMGAVFAAAGLRMMPSSPVGGAALLLPGIVLGGGGLLLAAGRQRYRRVMEEMAARIRRNLADADEVIVYEVEAEAGCVVGGDTDAFDAEWSGAVMRTSSGGLLFVDALVAFEFPRDEQGVQRVPRTMEVRTLPTHDLVRVVLSDDVVGEALELTERDGERLGKWVIEDLEEDDTPPCREIPAGVIE